MQIFIKIENESIDIEDLIDDFNTFFVAGQETTSNTLAFCFLELAKHPNIVKKYIIINNSLYK
jgi:cholesterol 24-hydroxylase